MSEFDEWKRSEALLDEAKKYGDKAWFYVKLALITLSIALLSSILGLVMQVVDLIYE